MKTKIHMKYLTREDVNRISDLGATVVDRVDEALAVKGMTRKKLGQRAGIRNKGYAASWWGGMRRSILEGRFNPSMGMVLRIARALGADPDDLMQPMK